MNALAALQTDFLARIRDDGLPLPSNWTARGAAGLEIYRNNYRITLVEALTESFARTACWVGADIFQQAATHHVIVHPPVSWTLDHAGLDFDRTLAALFPGDPEVAELAWAEWAMFQAFGARDALPLDGAGFAAATARFGETEWSGLRLGFVPGLTTRLVRHDLGAIWRQLDAADQTENWIRDAAVLPAPVACHVYREAEQPVFALAPAHETAALSAMQAGTCFGGICAMLAESLEPETAAAEAGAMLGRWLQQGLIEGVW